MPTGNIAAAISKTPDTSLDDAQIAKKRHLAAKLMLNGGQRVLDIGCGWGGLGLYLAEFGSAQCYSGITLSQEQHAIANERAAEKILSDRARFLLQDYRDLQGRLIASSRWHVRTCRRGHIRYLLQEVCNAALRRWGNGSPFHWAFGRSGRHQSLIAKYIFPGVIFRRCRKFCLRSKAPACW